MEAIILAGGLGTRLQSVVNDLPKCLAPVAGRPFLFYVIQHLLMQKVQRIIFSLGYKHEFISDFITAEFPNLNYEICIEEELLGTGGAIQFALQKSIENDVIVVNGDTLFRFEICSLIQLHRTLNAICTLALKPMENFDRYGVVQIDKNGIITSFDEKSYYENGLINAGVYIINKNKFLNLRFQNKFSFENDFLEKEVHKSTLAATVQNNYFIDIGIPQDFHQANQDLEKNKFDIKAINNNWTLFLDRDGVINQEKEGAYVLNKDEFKFLEGMPELFEILSNKFKYIIIVTNQRGIGKGLMSEKDLDSVHQEMKKRIEKIGGHINAIYFAPDTDSKNFYRKPNIGMAIKAKQEFPDIDFGQSIMVGNNYSDMLFGKSAGMYTIFIKTTIKNIPVACLPNIDKTYNCLQEFTNDLL
jgi:D-glycero-alpha-D-manno-heptose 1-phosphate guanylyltransferase